MSLAVKPKKSTMQNAFGKALNKFSREDPTLRVKVDPETKETILSGMGELHLEVYIERMNREYGVECIAGQPNVNYKETINKKETFGKQSSSDPLGRRTIGIIVSNEPRVGLTQTDWVHKKQTGGSGQYARVMGFVEPLSEEEQKEIGKSTEFANRCIGTNIPPEYYSSCQKGMEDAMLEGALVGAEVEGVRVVLQDGASHAVDSSDMAFRTCMANAIRETMKKANPSILEPVMRVEVEIPSEFQGTVVAALNRRMGLIQNSDMNDDGSGIKIAAEVPLSNMFGYSTELRSLTQGKGEFSMEYLKHTQVPKNAQEELMKKYKQEQEANSSNAA